MRSKREEKGNFSGRFQTISKASKSGNKLRRKVEEIEDVIDQFKSEKAKKIGLFITEIENLDNKVKIQEIEFDTQLSKQREQYIKELAELDKRNQEEEEILQARLNELIEHRQNYSQKRTDLTSARKIAELNDLKHYLSILKLQNHERLVEKNTDKKQNVAILETDEVKLKLKLESIATDVADVRESIQKNLMNAKLKLQEIETNYQHRAEETAQTVENTRNKYEELKSQCEESVMLAQQNANQVINQLEKENADAIEHERTLKDLKKKLKKKYAQQESDIKKEIELTKTTIEESKERIETQTDETVELMDKITEMQNKNLVLESQLATIKEDISKMKSEIKQMKNEKGRMETTIFSTNLTRITSKVPRKSKKIEFDI